jgi:hypothetical protein
MSAMISAVLLDFLQPARNAGRVLSVQIGPHRCVNCRRLAFMRHDKAQSCRAVVLLEGSVCVEVSGGSGRRDGGGGGGREGERRREGEERGGDKARGGRGERGRGGVWVRGGRGLVGWRSEVEKVVS